jgi:hypothetical protein
MTMKAYVIIYFEDLMLNEKIFILEPSGVN